MYCFKRLCVNIPLFLYKWCITADMTTGRSCKKEQTCIYVWQNMSIKSTTKHDGTTFCLVGRRAEFLGGRLGERRLAAHTVRRSPGEAKPEKIIRNDIGADVIYDCFIAAQICFSAPSDRQIYHNPSAVFFFSASTNLKEEADKSYALQPSGPEINSGWKGSGTLLVTLFYSFKKIRDHVIWAEVKFLEFSDFFSSAFIPSRGVCPKQASVL